MFLLMGLLHPDPRKRTTIKDCEKDLWVNQPIDISIYRWEEVLPNTGTGHTLALDIKKEIWYDCQFDSHPFNWRCDPSVDTQISVS